MDDTLPTSNIRLYRGLGERYKAGRFTEEYAPGMVGTNFTDSPYAALNYANGRSSEFLVIDIPEAHGQISEALWFEGDPKRFIIWGRFDQFLVAVLPAKEVRALVRCKGVLTQDDRFKDSIILSAVEKAIVRAKTLDSPVCTLREPEPDYSINSGELFG